MRMSLNNDGAPIEAVAILWSEDGDFDAATPHLNMMNVPPAPSLPCAERFDPIWRGQCLGSNNTALAPLQRRFEIIAQTNPAARAVACNGRFLTYGELDTQADELALQLQRDGLPPGSFCLLRLEPSLAFARVILAILKAGAACLQVDPALTKERIASVMAMLQPALLFVHERDRVGRGDDAMHTVRCDEDAAPLPPGWPDEVAVVDDTPAHVFATVSASGGLCMKVRTHKALAARFDAVGDAGPLAAADPAAFWRSLSSGALLTIAPRA